MDKGGQPGNQNAADGKIWRAAIRKALDKRSESRVDGKKAIDELAEKLLDCALEGQIPAFREIGDRIEGKPAQQIQLADNEGGKLSIQLVKYADTP